MGSAGGVSWNEDQRLGGVNLPGILWPFRQIYDYSLPFTLLKPLVVEYYAGKLGFRALPEKAADCEALWMGFKMSVLCRSA